jgi:tryptophan-rich sensory protein
MKLDALRAWANLGLVIWQIVVSGLAGGKIGEISGRYPTYVVPADYAFIIWSLIFALSTAYAVYQFLPSQRNNRLLQDIGWLTAAAFLGNSIWITVFQKEMLATSAVVIAGILLSLVAVLTRIYRHIEELGVWESRLVYTTFSIFGGWITVAAVANITLVLVALGWDGFGIDAATWGVLILLVTGVLGAVVTYVLRGNAPYGLTIVWALTAVAVNQATGSVSTSSNGTILTAALMALLVLATVGGSWLQQKSRLIGAANAN